MDFTPAQTAAMETHGRTLLVSAAAGSGKTFTLTQRIIKSIINENKDISDFLIVTFTRAAAGELKAKISKALGDAIEENPDKTHLQDQLIKLGGAHISTIDSFFAEPVRANFEKLGLPPSMKTADEAELEPLRQRIMSEVIDTYFDSCEALDGKSVSDIEYADDFTHLVGMISSARRGSAVAVSLLAIYRKLMTSPLGIGQLKAHTERMRHSAEMDFLDTPEGTVIREEMISTLSYVEAMLQKCCVEMSDIDLLQEKYVPCFEENRTACISLREAIRNCNYVEAQKAFESFKPTSIPPLRNNKTEISEYYKNLRGKKLNPAVKELAKKYLSSTPDKIRDFYLRSASICDIVIDILEKFDEKYTEEKLLRSICEFSDMPRYMLQLLQNSDGSPTEYADSLYERFKEVYIDEYQDVNEIQDTIFRIIGRDHRFMVGDIKQSIYGFREAEPRIFAEYRERFTEYDRDNDTVPDRDGGNTIFMSENFRCDENVINFTNAVCSKIFSAFAESIGYTSSDDLVFKKKKPYEDYESPKVVLNVIQSPKRQSADEGEETINESESVIEDEITDANASPDKLYDESVVVANEIARLIREEKKADGSPILPGDIAVLVRNHSSAKPLVAQLEKLGIKYAQASKTALLESRDMKLLIDLLSVIDNPRQDIPLCNVITSHGSASAPSLSLEETVEVRRQISGAKSLFDAMKEYKDTDRMIGTEQKCQRLVTHLDSLRLASASISADKLLRLLCHSEFFSHLCHSDAYNYLYDCACKYVRSSWNGLYNFLGYFKKLVEKGSSGSEPIKSADDAVTIMSIHQSKGLEFPVCFIFRTEGQFNMSDTHTPILFSKDFGLSMKLPPAPEEHETILSRIRVRYRDNVLHHAASIKIREKQIEEEARNLYVALTRARERLYLSATLNTDFESFKRELISCPDKEYEIKKSKSYFRQTLLALSSLLEEESPIFTVNLFNKGENVLSSPFAADKKAVGNEEALTEVEKELASLFAIRLGESEEERILANIPAKVAASKVRPNMLDNSVFIPTPTGTLFTQSDEDRGEQSSDSADIIRNRIRLMRSQSVSFDTLLETNKKPTAAEIGTATHQFLQFCDFKKVAKSGISAEIERLLKHKFISQRTFDIINKKQLEGFFKSDLFAMIIDAKSIRREFRFGLFKDAASYCESEKLRSAVSGKSIFVQGSIDLIIEDQNGEILLCDYKTDRISPEERADRTILAESMKEKHLSQLLEYRYAIEQIFEKTPSKIFIYSVPLGEVIEMNID